ncbi:MAG TPA: hypothetical protein VM537_04820 [Anaerolineae bacterium]|nr:hypothetical protein [Anaerolineae bacterium]
MSQEPSREDFAAATKEWVEADLAVQTWLREHFAAYYPDSAEPMPPEPKAVTRESLAELKTLQLAAQTAREKWARINSAYLSRS